MVCVTSYCYHGITDSGLRKVVLSCTETPTGPFVLD